MSGAPAPALATALGTELETEQATEPEPVPGQLLAQLREANQHLVMATVGAQDELSSAQAENRRREQFLSMLAHELRNPLAPIAMATQLLGKLSDSHPQLPGLHAVLSRQVAHMAHLIDDLLDASRISSGKILLQKQALRLADVIDSARETSQPLIDRRHQQLQCDLPPTPIWLEGDAIRLAQVFANLLINAAKFSPEYEQIRISAKPQGDKVSIAIRDHGIGIAPEQQALIFDLFTQGFQSMERSQGGLGIGLALVRSMVELHHGSVSVSSGGLGMGSVFTVLLPMCPAPPCPAPPCPATTQAATAHSATAQPPATSPAARHAVRSAAHNYRILLIEDHADTNETMIAALQQEGHSIASAADGNTGLAMALAGEFDAIVCDLGLPGISGYEVARALTQQTALHAPHARRPYLIALTGYHQPEHKSLALEAGFDHFLVKPVAIEVLLDLISTCAGQ